MKTLGVAEKKNVDINYNRMLHKKFYPAVKSCNVNEDKKFPIVPKTVVLAKNVSPSITCTLVIQ